MGEAMPTIGLAALAGMAGAADQRPIRLMGASR
jgi:hypothetical protein